MEDFFDANPWAIHLIVFAVLAGTIAVAVWPERFSFGDDRPGRTRAVAVVVGLALVAGELYAFAR